MPDMTLDEIRDRIAAKLGWHKIRSGWTYDPPHSDPPDCRIPQSLCHPVPASLDWVSENWPKGRNLTISRSRNTGLWSATSDGRFAINHITELHARFALLLAVLEAEGKTQ